MTLRVRDPERIRLQLLPELRDVVSQCKKRRENFQFSRHAQLKETRKDINYGIPLQFHWEIVKEKNSTRPRLVAEKRREKNQNLDTWTIYCISMFPGDFSASKRVQEKR
jgi:hypothetical protein